MIILETFERSPLCSSMNMVPSTKSLRYLAGGVQQLVCSGANDSSNPEHQKSQSFIKVSDEIRLSVMWMYARVVV